MFSVTASRSKSMPATERKLGLIQGWEAISKSPLDCPPTELGGNKGCYFKVPNLRYWVTIARDMAFLGARLIENELLTRL